MKPPPPDRDNAAENSTALPLVAFGPASRAMLARAGITSLAQLRALGSVAAYRRTKAVNAKASLNLLWAIEGLLSGRDWRVVARQDRLRLLNQLEQDDAD